MSNLQTRVEQCTETGGTASVEIATIIHEGREFTALGSVIDHERGRVAAYRRTGGILTNWGSKEIGTYHVVSTWRRYSRYGVSTKMESIKALIDGLVYYGRGSCDWELIQLKKGKK